LKNTISKQLKVVQGCDRIVAGNLTDDKRSGRYQMRGDAFLTPLSRSIQGNYIDSLTVETRRRKFKLVIEGTRFDCDHSREASDWIAIIGRAFDNRPLLIARGCAMSASPL
jgi:hypothetical protein